MTTTLSNRPQKIARPRMWMQVLAPVVFVIVFWAVTSMATNFYLLARDEAYQELLTANVASLQAANEIQLTTWQMIASWHQESDETDSGERLVGSHLMRIEHAISKLEKVAELTCDEVVLDRLRMHYSELLDAVQKQRIEREFEPSGAVAPMSLDRENSMLLLAVSPMLDAAEKLVVAQQEYLKQSNESRRIMQNRLLFIRILALVFGPLLGVYLGVRVTSLLQRRFAVLAITLRQGTASEEFQLEDVSVSGGVDLGQVQQLAESIRQRVGQLDEELQSARKEIIKSERLAAVGELAAGVAHELRNPLTSVKLLLQIAFQRHEEISLNREKSALILSEIGRMESIIQGLLDFSRPAQMRKTIHDIRVPIQRAVNLVAGRIVQSRVALQLELGDAPVFVEGDSDQLHQVMVNLVINSIDAMPDGGELSIKLEVNGPENRIRIAVHDSGPGIEKEILVHLFEPFTTTKERGTGLGLAVTHRIVQEHHGKIYAENDPAGGACFRVELPLANAE